MSHKSIVCEPLFSSSFRLRRFLRTCLTIPSLFFPLLLHAQQSTPMADPQPDRQPSINDVFERVANIGTVAPAAFTLSFIAANATNWTATGPISGREYHVSAAGATALAGGIIGGALVVRYLFPRTRKWIDTGLLVSSGVCAGIAYGNAQRH